MASLNTNTGWLEKPYVLRKNKIIARVCFDTISTLVKLWNAHIVERCLPPNCLSGGKRQTQITPEQQRNVHVGVITQSKTKIINNYNWHGAKISATLVLVLQLMA